MAKAVTGRTSVNALDFPNMSKTVDKKSWGTFVTKAASIEKVAGINLFTVLLEKVRVKILKNLFDPTVITLWWIALLRFSDY